jgi:DNA-binding Lrp family transcriptional regulator
MNIVPKEERNKRNRNTNEDNKNYVYYDSTLDKTNLKIIKQLIDNPNIKSSEMAEKLHIPLSTIQRRRAALEKTDIIKKEYSFDLKKYGIRVADLLIGIKNGEIKQVLDGIHENHQKNIISVSNKIGDPSIGYGIKIAYSNSNQLFNILEEIKKNPIVVNVKWYESVTEEKIQKSAIIDTFIEQ